MKLNFLNFIENFCNKHVQTTMIARERDLDTSCKYLQDNLDLILGKGGLASTCKSLKD